MPVPTSASRRITESLDSLRAGLRAGTRDLHAALDVRFSGGLHSQAHWHAYLGGMDGLVRGLAQAMAGIDAVPADWLPHLREAAGLLAADIEQAGASAGTVVIPRLPEAAAAFGAMYVYEGSALGARTLARARPESLFLAAHGAGARWRPFLATLEARRRGDAGAMLDGARSAFAAAAAAFDAAECAAGMSSGPKL